MRGAGNSITNLSGSDVLFKIENITQPFGTNLFGELVVPGLFRRLARVASTFQKIRYNRLTLRIVPQVSTTTSGGYICAFIADPADVPPVGADLVDHLISQKSSVANKWWQNATVSVPLGGSWYYTSRGVDVREYSPGSIVVASTGQSSQLGSLIVYAEWDVSLSIPTIERTADVTKEYLLKNDVYLRAGFEGLFAKVGTEWKSEATFILEDSEDAVAYELPTPVYVQDGAAISTATIKVCFWMIRTGTTFSLGTTYKDKGMANNALSDTLLLRAGTKVEPRASELNQQATLLTGPARGEHSEPSSNSSREPTASSVQLMDSLAPLIRSMVLLELENQRLPHYSSMPISIPSSSSESATSLMQQTQPCGSSSQSPRRLSPVLEMKSSDTRWLPTPAGGTNMQDMAERHE